jgi:hypothetical protein
MVEGASLGVGALRECAGVVIVINTTVTEKFIFAGTV